MPKKKIILDKFHYHEALDRTHMINCIINEHLTNHPVIQNHKKLLILTEKVEEILSDIYQSIGSLEFKLFPDEQSPNSKIS